MGLDRFQFISFKIISFSVIIFSVYNRFSIFGSQSYKYFSFEIVFVDQYLCLYFVTRNCTF